MTDNVHFADSRKDGSNNEDGSLQESAGFEELTDDDGDLPF